MAAAVRSAAAAAVVTAAVAQLHHDHDHQHEHHHRHVEGALVGGWKGEAVVADGDAVVVAALAAGYRRPTPCAIPLPPRFPSPFPPTPHHPCRPSHARLSLLSLLALLETRADGPTPFPRRHRLHCRHRAPPLPLPSLGSREEESRILGRTRLGFLVGMVLLLLLLLLLLPLLLLVLSVVVVVVVVLMKWTLLLILRELLLLPLPLLLPLLLLLAFAVG